MCRLYMAITIRVRQQYGSCEYELVTSTTIPAQRREGDGGHGVGYVGEVRLASGTSS